ncbi:MAG TPA: hypothetical protein ENF78_01640 [Candidatus Bathyarchaeota archaeon]|nr:hypothetical protein [Candidatus Bathyarchaeota archaeon]
MSKRAKARLALRSISRALGRAYRRLSALKPSPFVVAIIAVAAAIFLFGGGIYDLIMNPVVYIPRAGAMWVTYPYTMLEQTLMESMISMLYFAFGFIGLYLMYESTKYADEPYRAWIRFIPGLLILIAAFVLGQYMLRVQKLGR